MRPQLGIVVDGAHSNKQGITECRGVNLENGKEIFRYTIGNQTNNIGEFTAIIIAIKHIIENNFLPPVIYSDSTTAMSWVKNKKTASKKKYKEMQKAEIYLKIMSSHIDTIEIKHWDNKTWGENPADFGYK